MVGHVRAISGRRPDGVSLIMSTIKKSLPADRLIVSIEQRRDAVLDVIRQARQRITLSLFRCTDEKVFAELAAAVRRGVDVEALVTSRAKGGKKKLAKLWSTLERTGALSQAVYRSGREVSREVPGCRRGPGARHLAQLHQEMFSQDVRRARPDARPRRGLRSAAADGSGLLPAAAALEHQRASHRRTRAGAPPVHRADRQRAFEHPSHRRQALGSRSRGDAQRQAGARVDGGTVFVQASRRAEIARQDHAHRRHEGRRRQPRPRGVEPRFPARGRDCRRRAVGGG